jgi:hypothetical protein
MRPAEGCEKVRTPALPLLKGRNAPQLFDPLAPRYPGSEFDSDLTLEAGLAPHALCEGAMGR